MSAMWFKSIEVSRFRQFRSAVEVCGLRPGLNVIAGDNEEGKSTLLQALRAALFERYSSSAADGYRPYGESVSPRVHLVFALDGTEYRLDKVFSRRKVGEVTLSASDGRRWEGPQAEEFLAGLLGFSYAARGASRPEHQGLAALLWVEQAHAFLPVAPSDAARRRLHAVFDGEMSELLGGEHGEVLHRRIEERRRAWFDARDRPRGEYRRLQERRAALAERLERATSELQGYEQRTDQLGRRHAALRRHREDRALEQAQARLSAAQEARAQVQALASQVEARRRELSLAQAGAEAARLAWQARARLIEERREAEAVRAAAGARLAACEREVAPAGERVEALKAAIAADRQRQSGLETALRRAQNAERLARLSAEAQALENLVREARAAAAGRRDCLAQRDAIKVTDEALEALRTIERHRALAEVRLDAAASRLDYVLQPSASLRLSGAPLQGAGSVRLAETALLEIEGVGCLTIHPGGEDLAGLRAQLDEHAGRLAERLAELGVADSRAAEHALSERAALDNRARELGARLGGLAPAGLGELEERWAALERQRQALAGVGEDAGAAADSDALQREIGELAERLGSRERELAEHQRSYSASREAFIEAKAAAGSAQARAEAAGQMLEAARETAADDRLAAALAEAERGLAAAGQRLEAVGGALAAVSPDAVAREVERCGTALERLQADIGRLEAEARDLSVELGALGQRGLAEELAQAESDYAALERELSHVEAEAFAVDLLYRTLDAALRKAKEAVGRPVMARLLPYLRQLIPQAEPSINEDMMLTGIRRENAAEAFEHLSIGTREQLAVLVRLAYADLLSEQGQPVTVVLDDALVNSDDERRERMKAILYQAARRYQVLVLTCHEREYRDAGGTFIRLADCKAAATG